MSQKLAENNVEYERQEYEQILAWEAVIIIKK